MKYSSLDNCTDYVIR